jgi:serine/threonine protein kinase
LENPELMLNPGAVIGERYRVLRELGGGGMKLVYLVEDTHLNRKAALAEMIDSFTRLSDQAAAIAAFEREADLLAELESEYIPRIYDRFSENTRHYLVMEYVPGQTLDERLTTAGGKLDENFVIAVATQVLEALEYLHGLTPPIIYRDLKPSNVIVKVSGRIKMVDFGIARHFQPKSTATMIGTQGYAPPEQYLGKVDARSDLYALGATLHQLLTGRDPTAAPPFSFPRASELEPGINPALAKLVDEALAYDVNRRIASAREFRRRLQLINAGSHGLPNATTAAGTRSADAPTMVLQRGPAPESRQGSRKATSSGVSVHEILCRNCLRTIPADATVCPYCRILLRGGKERRLGWLPLSFAGFLALAVAATLLFSSTAWRRRFSVGKVNSTPQPSRAQVAETASTDKLVSAAPPSPSPTQSLENTASPLPSPSTPAQISQQATLVRFVGCWHSANTREIVESRTATGILAVPAVTSPGALTLCWKAQKDGTIQFVPESEGYVKVGEEQRQSGIVSEFHQWRVDQVDEKEHRVILSLRTVRGYRDGSQAELEFRYSCRPDGSQLACTNQRTETLNQQPWYTEVDNFHMQRTD